MIENLKEHDNKDTYCSTDYVFKIFDVINHKIYKLSNGYYHYNCAKKCHKRFSKHTKIELSEDTIKKKPLYIESSGYYLLSLISVKDPNELLQVLRALKYLFRIKYIPFGKS